MLATPDKRSLQYQICIKANCSTHIIYPFHKTSKVRYQKKLSRKLTRRQKIEEMIGVLKVLSHCNSLVFFRFSVFSTVTIVGSLGTQSYLT